MDNCEHEYRPAYWREAFPSYKHCKLCGDVKSGTNAERQKWAKESPWAKQLEEASLKIVENMGESQELFSVYGKLKTKGKWTAIGKAFMKWFYK